VRTEQVACFIVTVNFNAFPGVVFLR